MKKNHKCGAWYCPALKKCLLTMRLVLVMSLISVMQAFALNAYTQNTKISLSATEMRLEEIIIRIEHDTYYRFAYDKNDINVDKTYSVDVRNAEIKELLNQLFSEGEINYSIVGRQIVLATSKGQTAVQQFHSISGKVTDSSGTPLPGVSVVIKGTTNGTITGADGTYILKGIPENAVLTFSFVGMKNQEANISGKSLINIIMEDETIGIDEVVAVGYGTQKKINLTGAIASINEKDIQKLKVTQPSQLLAGLASGITVTQSSGQPGKDDATLRIRGLGTFSSAGTSPLVLIDGISSDLNYVNASDIESISILKDAASAAIYGTRAANGVILIETKKGRKE